ncbi:MAG TPA: hypothetical protein VFX42_07110 [Gemmatimonadales bacterium]|nr:hypothetical protein [Gemmatimonadales bacterium]
MRGPTSTRDYFALALAAGLSIGCGSNAGTEPSGPIGINGLSVVVKSSEWTAEKSLMVVGENASAQIEPRTSYGCQVGLLWCPTPAVVQIRSSNPAVVGPAEQQVSAPASVTLVARAPGTTELTVRADTVTRLIHIEVNSEPLPLDAIQIFPINDASQNLTSVEVGVESYAVVTLVALRDGAAVYGLPLIINSSPLGIVSAVIGCPYTRLYPQCRDNSRTMTMEGLAPGDAQVTVTGRNVVASLTVHVPSPAASSLRPSE